jgi:hypothetical protein
MLIEKKNVAARRTELAVFLCLLLVWLLPRAMAFIEPFWHADDYTMWNLKTWSMLHDSARNGRLLNGPIIALYNLFPPPDHALGSIILRSLQGLLHVGAAFIIWKSLLKQLKPWQALAATLPFLSWAFNCEATLWIGATIYPAGALLSVLGVYLARLDSTRSRISGAACLALSVHTTQAAACLGIALYILLLLLDWIGRNRPGTGLSLRRVLLESAWIAGGYLAGGGLSLWLMKVLECKRRAESFSLEQNGTLVMSLLKRLWNFDGFYSAAFQYFLLLLPFAVLATLLLAIIKGRCKWPALLLVPVTLAGISLAPFAANFLSGNPLMPLRILYAGTVGWVALLATGFALSRSIGWTGTLYAVCGILFLALNTVPAIRETGDLCMTYREDRATLLRLEEFAAATPTREVLFMDYLTAIITHTHPYDYHYPYKDGLKYSIFQHHSWNYRFLQYYSDSLTLYPMWERDNEFGNTWDQTRHKYKNMAWWLPRDEWIMFHYAPDENIILVIPR